MALRKEVVPANLKEDLKAVFTKKQPVVYTTFRLSQKAQDAIKEHAKLSGLKNAVVFDLLLAVFEVCEKNPISLVTEENRTLIRRTYVVEKRTLYKLAEIAKSKKTSRDNIIEQAALQMKALFQKSESERKEKDQKVFDTQLKPFWEQVCDINEKLHEELGGDDPICNKFLLIVSAVDGFMQDIEAYLTKGTPIDPDAL